MDIENFDLKSAFITFVVTFFACLIVHSIRVDGLENAVYGLSNQRLMDEQTILQKNQQIQQAVVEINRLNRIISEKDGE